MKRKMKERLKQLERHVEQLVKDIQKLKEGIPSNKTPEATHAAGKPGGTKKVKTKRVGSTKTSAPKRAVHTQTRPTRATAGSASLKVVSKPTKPKRSAKTSRASGTNRAPKSAPKFVRLSKLRSANTATNTARPLGSQAEGVADQKLAKPTMSDTGQASQSST